MRTLGYTDARLAAWGRWLSVQVYGQLRAKISSVYRDGLPGGGDWDDSECEQTHHIVLELPPRILEVVRLHYTRPDLRAPDKAARLSMGKSTYWRKLRRGQRRVDRRFKELG